MAIATELGNGLYDLQYDDGRSYQVPFEQAREAAPDSFPSAEEEWLAQHGAEGLQTSPEPEPEMPGPQYPWEQPGYQEGLGEPQSEMVFSEDEVAPMGGAPTIANQMANIQPEDMAGYQGPEMEFGADEVAPMGALAGDRQGLAPGQSRSGSMSASWSKPYREAQQGKYPGPMETADIIGYNDETMQLQQEAFDETSAGVEDSLERRGKLVDEYGKQNLETVEESDRMHRVAMEEVQAAEQELQRDMAQVTRMDMGKVWKDTAAPAKFAGMMAAGIAGWLNPTGNNSVIEQMMEIVDQSAREQAANIATEKFQIQGQERALGRLEQRGEDEEKRYLKNRALLITSLDAMVGQEAAKYSSVITLGQFQQQRLELRNKKSEAITELRKTVHAQSMRKSENIATDERAAAALRAAAARQRMSIRAADRRAKASAGPAAPTPYKPVGKGLFTLDSKGGKVGNTVFSKEGISMTMKNENELKEAIVVGRSLAADGRRLYFLINEMGRQGIRPEVRQKYAKAMNDLVESMRPKVGANLPEGEREGVYKQWGSPHKILNSPEASKKLVSAAIRRQSDILKQMGTLYGLQEGVPRLDEKGQAIYQLSADGKSYEPVLDYRAIGRAEDMWGDEFANITPGTAEKEGIKFFSAPFDAASLDASERGVEVAPGSLDEAGQELIDFAGAEGITRETSPEGHAEVVRQLSKASPGMVTRYGVEADRADRVESVKTLINGVGLVQAMEEVYTGKSDIGPIDFREALEILKETHGRDFVNPFTGKMKE